MYTNGCGGAASSSDDVEGDAVRVRVLCLRGVGVGDIPNACVSVRLGLSEQRTTTLRNASSASASAFGFDRAAFSWDDGHELALPLAPGAAAAGAALEFEVLSERSVFESSSIGRARLPVRDLDLGRWARLRLRLEEASSPDTEVDLEVLWDQQDAPAAAPVSLAAAPAGVIAVGGQRPLAAVRAAEVVTFSASSAALAGCGEVDLAAAEAEVRLLGAEARARREVSALEAESALLLNGSSRCGNLVAAPPSGINGCSINAISADGAADGAEGRLATVRWELAERRRQLEARLDQQRARAAELQAELAAGLPALPCEAPGSITTAAQRASDAAMYPVKLTASDGANGSVADAVAWKARVAALAEELRQECERGAALKAEEQRLELLLRQQAQQQPQPQRDAVASNGFAYAQSVVVTPGTPRIIHAPVSSVSVPAVMADPVVVQSKSGSLTPRANGGPMVARLVAEPVAASQAYLHGGLSPRWQQQTQPPPMPLPGSLTPSRSGRPALCTMAALPSGAAAFSASPSVPALSATAFGGGGAAAVHGSFAVEPTVPERPVPEVTVLAAAGSQPPSVSVQAASGGTERATTLPVPRSTSDAGEASKASSAVGSLVLPQGPPVEPRASSAMPLSSWAQARVVPPPAATAAGTGASVAAGVAALQCAGAAAGSLSPRFQERPSLLLPATPPPAAAPVATPPASAPRTLGVAADGSARGVPTLLSPRVFPPLTLPQWGTSSGSIGAVQQVGWTTPPAPGFGGAFAERLGSGATASTSLLAPAGAAAQAAERRRSVTPPPTSPRAQQSNAAQYAGAGTSACSAGAGFGNARVQRQRSVSPGPAFAARCAAAAVSTGTLPGQLASSAGSLLLTASPRGVGGVGGISPRNVGAFAAGSGFSSAGSAGAGFGVCGAAGTLSRSLLPPVGLGVAAAPLLASATSAARCSAAGALSVAAPVSASTAQLRSRTPPPSWCLSAPGALGAAASAGTPLTPPLF
eukprot:TRINITY_DN3866_c1_g2_i1.p1 TRINITY_DN3866_c1_g2~~TRINITY_DN3866_c1_g2_i1.p1  ORF type:complete len:1042 (+),score=265.73 TRINITY_DN3866_c1_g2_i1:168-3128(+)